MKIKHILLILCFFVASFVCIGCSTDGSNGTSFNENLVTKTWYSTNNGTRIGNHSEAKWSYTFAECEKISDTQFNVIYETRLFFYTTLPSTSVKRYQTAERARAKCSNWNYRQITDDYKQYVTTLNNGTKFYRQKVKQSKYTSIF